MYSPVTIFSLISSITTCISNHDIQPSLYGLAIFASKEMDIFSHALSVFLVKHEIKMISIFVLQPLKPSTLKFKDNISLKIGRISPPLSPVGTDCQSNWSAGLIDCQSICWKKLHQMHCTLKYSGTRMSSNCCILESYDGIFTHNYWTLNILGLSVWKEKLLKTCPSPHPQEWPLWCHGSTLTFRIGSTVTIFDIITKTDRTV